MKVADLLNESKYDSEAAKRINFDAKVGRLEGPVKDWLSALGITDTDVKAAIEEIKKSKLFNSMEDKHNLTYAGSDKLEKNGTLRFIRSSTGTRFEISANGQIRGVGEDLSSRSPRKSAKPHLAYKDPIKSLVNIYSNALEKIIEIEKKTKSIKESENDEAVLSDAKLGSIAGHLEDLVDDVIFEVIRSYPHRDEDTYVVYFTWESGADPKNHGRGSAEVSCGFEGNRAVDFKLLDLTGIRGIKIDQSIFS